MMCRWLGMMAVFLIATSPVQGQVYQWVDENGVKHYSNAPPPEGVIPVRKYEEVQSQPETETAGESDTQSSPEAEADEQPASGESEQTIVESAAAADEAGEGEAPDGAETEDAGGLEEAADLEESDELEETVAPGAEENPDIEAGGEEEGDLENPASGQAVAEDLIAQERDRLEVRMVQLNSQLAEAQTARDTSLDNDVERWNKRIEQLRAQIEKEKSRSEARIRQIRNKTGLQP